MEVIIHLGVNVARLCVIHVPQNVVLLAINHFVGTTGIARICLASDFLCAFPALLSEEQPGHEHSLDGLSDVHMQCLFAILTGHAVLTVFICLKDCVNHCSANLHDDLVSMIFFLVATGV